MLSRLHRLAILSLFFVLFIFYLFSSTRPPFPLPDLPNPIQLNQPPGQAPLEDNNRNPPNTPPTYADVLLSTPDPNRPPSPPPSYDSLPPSPSTPILPRRSPYAYVFHATRDDYACSALVNMRRLVETFRTRHRLIVFVTPSVSAEYRAAFAALHATVYEEEAPPLPGGSLPLHAGSLLKLLAFGLHRAEPHLRRVLVLDADVLIVRSLDALFELPDVDVAAPRAYWLARGTFAPGVMLVSLGERVWRMVDEAMRGMVKGQYLLDVVNGVFGDTMMMLPGQYMTLNSHWTLWDVPAWFREDGPREGMVEEGRRVRLGELWEAINIMVEGDEGKERESEIPEDKGLRKRGEGHEHEHEHGGASDSSDLETEHLGEIVDPNSPEEKAAREKAEAEVPKQEEKHFTSPRPHAPASLPPPAEKKPSEEEKKHAAEEAEKRRQEDTAKAQKAHHDAMLKKIKDDAAARNEKFENKKAEKENAEKEKAEKQKTEKDSAGKEKEGGKNKEDHESPTKPTNVPIISPTPILRPPEPFTPETHPNKTNLETLHNTIYVLHFTQGPKPWAMHIDKLKENMPNAHPLFYEQFRIWRQAAHDFCPKKKAPKTTDTGDEIVEYTSAFVEAV